MSLYEKKNALFDFADTIAELKPNRQTIIFQYIKNFTREKISKKKIIRICKRLDILFPYSSVNCKHSQQKKDFYLDYNEHLLNLLGLSHLTDPIDLYKKFQIEKHWVLKKKVKSTLNKLKNAGFQIGIISNFDPVLKNIVLKNNDLENVIDYLHISGTEGLEKPNIKFYTNFFEKHNLDIKNSFYVGDNYFLDFAPSKKIGLESWLLDEFDLYPHIGKRIKNFSEILLNVIS